MPTGTIMDMSIQIRLWICNRYAPMTIVLGSPSHSLIFHSHMQSDCVQEYMKGELEELALEYDIVPISPAEGDWSQATIDYWVEYCKEHDVPCVVGFAQKDSWHHPLINAGLGNVTIQPLAYLIAMNKSVLASATTC